MSHGWDPGPLLGLTRYIRLLLPLPHHCALPRLLSIIEQIVVASKVGRFCVLGLNSVIDALKNVLKQLYKKPMIFMLWQRLPQKLESTLQNSGLAIHVPLTHNELLSEPLFSPRRLLHWRPRISACGKEATRISVRSICQTATAQSPAQDVPAGRNRRLVPPLLRGRGSPPCPNWPAESRPP